MTNHTAKTQQRASVLALINGCWTTQAIAAAATLGVPALLAESPRGIAALAKATNSHEPSLRRLLRALTSLGLCKERNDGYFELTPLGRWLEPDVPDTLDPWARMRAVRWAEWGELTESVRTGECHQKRHAGTDDFSRLEGSPDAPLFHSAMVALTRRVALGVADAIGFTGDELLVDVGGSSGELLATLVAAHPQTRGIVLDMAHARSGALAHLDAAGLSERCEFVTGSFFDALPAGGDVYLLKSVLHNWDDKRAGLILSRCRAAMGPGARLLIVERLMPEVWEDTDSHRACAASDLNMLATLSGRERTAAEFASLLDAASFRVDRVLSVGADFHVVEAS